MSSSDMAALPVGSGHTTVGKAEGYEGLASVPEISEQAHALRKKKQAERPSTSATGSGGNSDRSHRSTGSSSSDRGAQVAGLIAGAEEKHKGGTDPVLNDVTKEALANLDKKEKEKEERKADRVSPEDAVEREHLYPLFDYFDTDRDGYLTVPEFINALKVVGVTVLPSDALISDIPDSGCIGFKRFFKIYLARRPPKHDAGRVFTSLDTTRSGVISNREFKQTINRHLSKLGPEQQLLQDIQLDMMYFKMENMQLDDGFTDTDFHRFLEKSRRGVFHIGNFLDYDQIGKQTDAIDIEAFMKMDLHRLLEEMDMVKDDSIREKKKKFHMVGLSEREADEMRAAEFNRKMERRRMRAALIEKRNRLGDTVDEEEEEEDNSESFYSEEEEEEEEEEERDGAGDGEEKQSGGEEEMDPEEADTYVPDGERGTLVRKKTIQTLRDENYVEPD